MLFRSADSSTTRKFGGTGLGLVISQHLVDAMKGEIGISSAEGEGATFSFSVSLKKSRESAQPMMELQGQQVCIMESAATMRMSITHLMEQWQVRYSDTDNRDILLQCLLHKQQNDDPVNAVILGLSRKELYLASTAQLIKDISAFNVPIIALVNSTVAEELEYAQTLGAVQSLYKPLQSRTLFQSLCSCLNINPDTDNRHYTASHISPPTILAVDDNEANLKLLKVLLEDMGITVVTADSGPQSLLKIEEHDIDMIFMDIQMPGMNGLEATQLIRLHKSSTELPIIALTAHAIADEKDAILQAGMNDYQSKPINNDRLIQSIERWTGYRCYGAANNLPAKQEQYQVKETIDHPALPEPKALTNNSVADNALEDCLVFDPEYAMRLANNKLDLAIDMFTMLLNSLPQDLQSIADYWQTQQHEQLLQQVHKVHGATRYCGTPCLMNRLEQFETALKNSELVDCDELYHQTIESMINIQRWAQENPWQEKLERVAIAKS